MPTSSSSSAAADDRRLVERFVRSADEDAFRRLYRAHAPALYRLALRLVRGDSAAAQDILQETWLRAVPRLGTFRWQSTLRTWLSAVAINVHREELRQRSRGRGSPVEARRHLFVVDGGKPGHDVAGAPDVRPQRDSEAVADLERAVAELPDGYREVLVLHDIEGYTHKEIAALLGVEEGTSKSQLSKARRAMRTWLDQQRASFDAR